MSQDLPTSIPSDEAAPPSERPLPGCLVMILLWLGVNILFSFSFVIVGYQVLIKEHAISLALIVGPIFTLTLIALSYGVFKRKRWGRIGVLIYIGLDIVITAAPIFTGGLSPAAGISAIPMVLIFYWLITNPSYYYYY